MSESRGPEDFEIRIAAVLDEFAAAQRAQGVDAARRQRIMFVRSYEGAQMSFEGIIDENASAKEIFEMLDRVDFAMNRMKAKSDLSEHYDQLIKLCGQIEMSNKRLAANTIAFHAEQTKRRVPKLTDQQAKGLKDDEDQIRVCWEQVEKVKKNIEEAKRILEGVDPFAILGEQVEKRLAETRRLRLREAA